MKKCVLCSLMFFIIFAANEGVSASSYNDFSQLEENVRILTGKVEELEKEIADLKSQIAKSNSEENASDESNNNNSSDNKDQSVDISDKTANDIIKEAKELIKKDKGEKARKLLNAFIDKNSEDIHVGMMHFYIGDSFFKEKSYKAAAREFMQCYKVNSRGEKAPEALYELGLSFKELGDDKKAIMTLEKLVEDHPSSEFCEKAKKELSALKKKRKKDKNRE